MLSDEVPLSEDLHKFQFMSAEECVDELRRIALLDINKFISRNYFRVHSRISESTWSAHFGTFHEFKRQAGITLSRHAHRMELDVAKHASVDTMRRFNADKAGWEDKYLKPTSTRWQTVLAASDLHDREMDKFFEHCFLDTAKRVQPDKIVLNGDIFDLPEFGKYSVDPRHWDAVGRILVIHKFLEKLREAAPNSEIIFVEGNHEYRLLRHLAEESPAMRAVLSDLHGFTVPRLLGLDAYEINYISRSDLGTFGKSDLKREIAKNYWIGYECLLAHHFPEGRDMGLPGFNGHHHKHLVTPGYSPVFGSYEWHQLGCGHKTKADYCAGEKWSNGFLLVHVDTHSKKSAFEYVQIQDHAVIGGRWYLRDNSESF